MIIAMTTWIHPENNYWICANVSDIVLDTGDTAENNKDKSPPLWIVQSNITQLWRKCDGEK